LGVQGVNERIILKWILDTQIVELLIGLSWLRLTLMTGFGKHVKLTFDFIKEESLFFSLITVICTRKTLYHVCQTQGLLRAD
jgi:hypothetical protein